MRSRAFAMLSIVALSGCESTPSVKADPPVATAAAVSTPTARTAATPEAPEKIPAIRVRADAVGIGFSTLDLGKPDGPARLESELQPYAALVRDAGVPLVVERKAKRDWVMTVMDAITALGARSIVVTTETRKGFSGEVAFTPEARVTNADPCSVVAMITDDYHTSVWKLSGGAATGRKRGFAGPDLTSTTPHIARHAKGCASSTIFVSAAAPVDWGLTYDLAALTKTVEGVTFDKIVLLHVPPTPGRPVEVGAK